MKRSVGVEIRLLQRLLAVAGLAIALLLLCYSLRWAWADWLSKDRTSESIHSALMLAPENWEYDEDWAEIEPAQAPVALRKAVSLNPLNPGILLELAAAEEQVGNVAAAESLLIRAAAFDQTAGPRTLLAEFYFRQGKANLFRAAAKSAFKAATNPPASLFEDCWLLISDPSLILKEILPDRAEVLLPYLQFLVENHLDAAQPVALNLMGRPCCSSHGRTDAESMHRLLIDYLEQLVAHNKVSDAVVVWNWLSAKKLIPYQTLTPSERYWLVNSRFEVPPTEIPNGFDWRLQTTEGVFVEPVAEEHQLAIMLTGRQPEHCDLLAENVVLWPSRRYRLLMKYSTSNMESETGLHWLVVMPSGEDLLSRNPASNHGAVRGGKSVLAAENMQETFSFDGPPQPTIARLLLAYDRVQGTVRTEGTIKIREVDGTIE